MKKKIMTSLSHANKDNKADRARFENHFENRFKISSLKDYHSFLFLPKVIDSEK